MSIIPTIYGAHLLQCVLQRSRNVNPPTWPGMIYWITADWIGFGGGTFWDCGGPSGMLLWWWLLIHGFCQQILHNSNKSSLAHERAKHKKNYHFSPSVPAQDRTSRTKPTASSSRTELNQLWLSQAIQSPPQTVRTRACGALMSFRDDGKGSRFFFLLLFF